MTKHYAHQPEAVAINSKGSAKPQDLTDDTFIEGGIIDRQDHESMEAIFNLAFTSASGVSGAAVTVTIQLFDDSDSAMAAEAAFGDAYTYEYTWAADGANSGVHVLPVDLTLAKRYIKIKAKITESGTITLSNQLGAITACMAGLRVAPDPDHAGDGYQSTVEAS